MVIRLLLAFVSSFVFASQSFAQFKVPESQLSYVETELKKVRDEYFSKADALNYKDPGADAKGGWRVSQAAWEKMELKIGYPPEPIRKILDVDPAKRSGAEKTSVRNFYLGFVNKKSRLQLQRLAERYGLLQAHKRAGEGGITQNKHYALAIQFWQRRFVDAYRMTTSDKPKTQAIVIKYLDSAARNYANDGWLDNSTNSLGHASRKAGCKHPIVRLLTLDLGTAELKKKVAKLRKDIPSVIADLQSDEYSPILRMLARDAHSDFFRLKNMVDGKELFAAEADKLEKKYNEAILEMLADESACPENIDFLENVLAEKAIRSTRGFRPGIALFEMLSESDLHDGFKAAALQRVGSRIGWARNVKDKDKYLKSAQESGELAVKLLPLSVSVVERLMADTFSSSQPEVLEKWFEVGKQRGPGRYFFVRNYFNMASQCSDADEQSKFILEMLSSDAFSADVPWNGLWLIKEGIGWNEKEVGRNKEVLLALEALLKKAPDQGKSPEWCKKEKQYLIHCLLYGGHFEDALRVAKELDGDFGRHEYQGQKMTLARLAKLCNQYARQIDESIDDGTFDATKVGETIEKLTETRMDMGTDEGTYIDELLELLKAVEAFEAGQWADLTPDAVHLTNWKSHDHSDWRATKNGVEAGADNKSITGRLEWRWKVKNEYMLEADIDVTPLKGFSKKHGAGAGFAISKGPQLYLPEVSISLDPHKAIAIMDCFREKSFWVKPRLNEKGPNRVRMRVWKDYFEFTINGHIGGQYVMTSDIPGYVILSKDHGMSLASFKNVRIRKLNSPSPTGQRLDDVSYWSKRLKLEPDSKDVQSSLKNAKSKRKKEDSGEKKQKVAVSPAKRAPVKVKEGLAAMWTFDQDLSESLSKQGASAALPIEIVDGKVGQGLLLSKKRTSNLIVAEGAGPIDLEKPFSVCFWVRWETKDGVLISQCDEKAGFMIDRTDGSLHVKHWRPGLELKSNIRGDLPMKTWKHITVIYDGSNDAKNLKIFVSGKKRTDSVSSGCLTEKAEELPAIDSSKTKLHFGCHRFGWRPFYGSSTVIDELRVYDRELSPKEVKQVSSYGLK